MSKIEGGEQVLGCGWDPQHPNIPLETVPTAGTNEYTTKSLGRWEVFGIGVSSTYHRYVDDCDTNDKVIN